MVWWIIWGIGIAALSKKLIKHSTNVTASTLVGAVDSLQYGGVGLAMATSGISTLAGAGIGLGLGLIGAAKNKGEELVSSGFDPVNLKLDSDFAFLEEMPLLSQEFQPVSTKLLGIDIRVKKVSKYKSRDYGEFMLVDVELANNGQHDLFMGDFILSSERHILPILNNPLLSNGGLNLVSIKNSQEMKLAFSLGSMKKNDKYQLMLLNPVTQEIIANTDIDIASYL